MNLLHYLLEANLYLGVFYLAYCLLLTKETYYQLTRAYLLFSCLAAFTLPILQIGALRPVEKAIDTTVSYLPNYTGQLPVINQVHAAPVVIAHHLTVQDYLMYVYITGACILFFMLLVKLSGLFRLMRKADANVQSQYKLVYLPQSNTAFSFFNYLFLGDNAQGANTIIRHELVHIRQKHSVDILFLEILKVINWFNPFIYLLQNSLKTVHEYIADEQTAAYDSDALTYSSFLVSNAYGAGGSSITHSFFNYNLLKKRIIMLNQQRSGNLARLKYLVAVPVFAGLLCTSTLAFSKTYGLIDLDPANPTKYDLNILPSSTMAPNEDPFRMPKTKPIKFPPPTVIDNKFTRLSDFLIKTVHYDNLISNDPGALVVISFNVTANHTIADAKVSRSTGTRFDAIALRGIKAYKGTVDAQPGERTFIFDFLGGSDDDKTRAAIIDADMDKRAGYVPVYRMALKPRLIVLDGKVIHLKANEAISADSMNYVPQLTKWAIDKWGDEARDGVYIYTGHGTVVKKSQSLLSPKGKDGGRVHAGLHNAVVPAEVGTTFIVNGKRYDFTAEQVKNKTLVSITCESMIVYEKGNTYAQSQWGNNIGKVAVLQGKNASIKIGTFDELANKTKAQTAVNIQHKTEGQITAGKITSTAVAGDTIAQQDQSDFLQDLGRNVKYAAADRNAHIQGKVVALFAVDADHNIQYIKVVKSPSDWMSNEVVRSLKINKYLNILKPGVQYTVPISFTLGVNDSSSGQVVEPGPITTGQVITYNPNNVDISNKDGFLALNEVVIRGYIKVK